MPSGDASVDIGTQIRSAHAHRAADTHRRQFALVDQAAHRARTDRKLLSGVLEG
jgi:hypothetical protein